MTVATMATMELSGEELARLGGAWVEGDVARARLPLAGITTDSREVVAGSAFVAVRGERMDGHEFVAEAVGRGAGCLLVEASWQPGPELAGLLPDLVVLRATGTADALRRASEGRLAALGATVVGITGSVGKTTAKEMTAHVLAGVLATERTPGNLNTWTGVPLSVLRLDPPVDVFVAEMGMSAAGEIADLCSFTHPRIGVVLNVGVSHLELLGSREAIAAAKAELLEALPPAGLAVLNGDDDAVRAMAARTQARVTWFGEREDSGVRIVAARQHGLAGLDLELATPQGTVAATLRAPGRHLACSAAAAAAVALELGLGPAEIAARLSTFEPVSQRGAVRIGGSGARIIDDSYNSAPASLAAALDLLVAGGSPTRIAVLGDMLELGTESDAAHEVAGRSAAGAATLLIAVGAQAERVAAAAIAAGLAADHVRVARDAAEAATMALEAIGPDATVLVKGSHSLHLERVVAALTEPAPARPAAR